MICKFFFCSVYCICPWKYNNSINKNKRETVIYSLFCLFKSVWRWLFKVYDAWVDCWKVLLKFIFWWCCFLEYDWTFPDDYSLVNYILCWCRIQKWQLTLTVISCWKYPLFSFWSLTWIFLIDLAGTEPLRKLNYFLYQQKKE